MRSYISDEDCYIRMTDLAKTIDEKITKLIYFQMGTFLSVIITLIAVLIK